MLKNMQVYAMSALVAGSVLLSGCADQESDTTAVATIEAYQTRVADLEEENETLLAENRELGTAVTDVQAILGIGDEAEPSATAIDPARLAPNAFMGNGETIDYGIWRIEFTDYSVDKEIVNTSSEFGGGWEADGMFHSVLLTVENTSQRSQEFPHSDFRLVEQYGAEYRGVNLIGGDGPTDSSRMLIPGNTYEVLLAFDIPEEAGGLVLVTEDQGIVLDLAGVDPQATPVPDVLAVIGDGTVVEYVDWRISFDYARVSTGPGGSYLYVLITVENVANEPRVFPYRELLATDSYGSTFHAVTIRHRNSDDYLDDANEDMLLPDREYELRVAFDVDDGSKVQQLKTSDGSAIIRLVDD